MTTTRARARRSGPQRRVDTDFVFDLPSVAEPALSPDGATVAYVRAQTDRDALEMRAHIEAMPYTGGEARQLTNGPRDRSPLWSPDGRTLAFVRREDGERKDGRPLAAQVWLLPLEGGEPRRLTDLRENVLAVTWAPDSRSLFVVSDVDPNLPPEDADPKVPRVREVTRIYYRADGLGWRGDTHRQLFRVDVETGDAKQLTRGDYDIGPASVSPDGRWIAFASSDRSPQRDRHLPGRSELCVMPADGGRVQRIVRGLMQLGPIAWSPDGRRLAYVAGGDVAFADTYLWTVARDGSNPTRVTDDSVQPLAGLFPLVSPPLLAWSGRRILFLADRRGSSGIYAATPSGRVEAVREEEELAFGWSVDGRGRRAVVHASTLTRPAELTAVDLGRPAVRRASRQPLTSVSRDYLRDRAVARTERFSVRRSELEVDCWLTFPPDFDRTQRYPLVLEIHGGPNGYFGTGWAPMHQLLAARGYLVLYANPRGSATYGEDFMSRVFRDWGGEDYLDLMTAVDEIVRRPYVDAERLGVHGYSYGGYMTAWIVGHTDRFRAAIVAAPVTNLGSMYGQTDIAVTFGESQWGGPPWENAAEYAARSPLTYAERVTTPVLLLHGEADIRCPISQSEEYYVALKRLGKDVEFVRFPGGYHSFPNNGHPAIREAYYRRVLDWFDRRLGGR